MLGVKCPVGSSPTDHKSPQNKSSHLGRHGFVVMPDRGGEYIALAILVGPDANLWLPITRRFAWASGVAVSNNLIE